MFAQFRPSNQFRYLAPIWALAAVAWCTFAPARCAAQVRLEVEAALGEPFGVGRITVSSGGDFRLNLGPRAGAARELPARGGRIANLAKRLAEQTGVKSDTVSLDTTEMALVERSGRVFYPVFEKRDRPILREFISVPKQTTLYFLFEGNQPLDLTVFTPQPQVGNLVPRRDPALFDRLLRSWWRDFSAAADDSSDRPQDFPPIVEEYLVDTLSRRLRLPIPERPAATDSGLLAAQLNLLAGTEKARQQAARAVLLGDAVRQAASEPLPFELPPPVPEVLNPSEAPVEPLSRRVPLECFYVRFGSFTNFLWLRHRLEDWGGEVRDIVSERGLDYGLNERMQRQLGLRESKLAELFGEKVIADVAMIGTDTFLREGAAIGILFQARNSAALNADFTQQRSAAVKETPGGKLEKITIDKHPATFISTPDNSLRSFYVVDGDYHLVTTSRTLAEWFVATGAGKHLSIGSSEAFRLARKYMPLERNDTVFAYFSPSFFQNLLSPQYQVELRRRLRSSVEIELVRIARLASQSEQRPAKSIAELVAGGFLPEGFGVHADGGHLEVNGATISDSLRGAPGSFLPVPDVPIDRVTPAELADYQQLAETYTTSWGAMDPIVAGIQRQSISKDLERVVLDVKAAPLSERHSKMLADWLGAPSDQRLTRVEGDVVAFEAILRGNSLFRAQEHHLFGALADADPTIALNPNTGLIPQLFKSKLQGLQGYLGAWPNPGFLQMLSIFGESTPDAGGYSRSLTGVWRRQFDNFTLVSFQPEILARVSPQLRFEKAERPAQVWIHAEDLAKSQLAPLINAYGYRQSRQMALGNTRFMNMLVEQLHVPQADAMTVAETLLSAKMLEPFGGKYELRELPGGQKTWVSTSVADYPSAKEPPAGYQMPALNWFRGIDLEVAMVDGLAALHGEVIMPVEARPAAGFSLPSLPFGKPAAAADPKAPKDAKDAAKPKFSLPKLPTLPAPAQPKPSIKREF